MSIGVMHGVLVIAMAMGQGHINASPMGASQRLVMDELGAAKNIRSVNDQDPTAVCPESYSEVGNTCYDHLNVTVDYATAVIRCNQNSNGHLAMLEDEGKRQQFNEYIQGEVGERLNVTCQKAMDVVFLIDTSGSMGRDGFKKEIDFIKQFVRNFDFGPGQHQSQFAIVDTRFSFDSVNPEPHIEVLIHLNDYTDMSEFLQAVTEDWFLGANAQPWRAFKKTRTDVLLTEKGARGDAEKILILISDRDPENIDLLEEEAGKVKNMGVQVFDLFVLGLNDISFTDEMALVNVVSDPPEEHMFEVNQASDLIKKISTLITEICRDTIEMWIDRSHDVAPTCSKGVMTTMNAAFTSGLRPKQEQHEFVCEADKVRVEK